MASTTLSSSLLLFIFITTPLHSIAFSSSSQYSTETDLHENPDHKSGSKASNGGGRGSGDSTKLWCVAKNNADDPSLQASLDWACGQGGTDCGPIQQGGPCYNPDDFQSTASYAFNDYFQRNGMTEESCNFANTAALTSLDPSHGNCQFPTRARVVVNGGFTTAGSANGVVGGGGGASGVSDDTSDVGGSQIRRRRRLWWVQASLITGVLIFAH